MDGWVLDLLVSVGILSVTVVLMCLLYWCRMHSVPNACSCHACCWWWCCCQEQNDDYYRYFRTCPDPEEYSPDAPICCVDKDGCFCCSSDEPYETTE